MAKPDPTPVHLIDEVRGVTVIGDRMFVTLSSYGAPVRLSLSRHAATSLNHMGRRAVTELFEQPQSCEIIPFARPA